MKKIALLIILSITPCIALAQEDLPNIFIWSVPEGVAEQSVQLPETPLKKSKSKKNEEIILDLSDDSAYNATILKGYTEYREAANIIFLKDSEDEFILNIKKPQKFLPASLINKQAVYSSGIQAAGKFSSDEYSISPSAAKTSGQIGGFSFGTSYSTDIDNSQLEQAASMFTRFEHKNFALSSSYRKTLGTTHGNIADAMYITPEFKLNNIFTVKDVFKSEITKERITHELVLSVNPLKGSDRLKFEFGAGQTFDRNHEITKTKIRFSTQFKL
ncbi:MAG: hypothetical protein LBK53_07220 [Heliobacteriaceae bacterium]|jgi:hypothetical protein|nr:hypothetical protein [Heliobacteriaceae bacterium]